MRTSASLPLAITKCTSGQVCIRANASLVPSVVIFSSGEAMSSHTMMTSLRIFMYRKVNIEIKGG